MTIEELFNIITSNKPSVLIENNEEEIGKDKIELLFELEKADLLAQSKEFHHPLLEQIEEEKEEILGNHK